MSPAIVKGLSGSSVANIPDVFSTTTTAQGGGAPAALNRVPAIMGLGKREETLIDSAQGKGADGSPSDFANAATDGRHFQLSNIGLVSNQTELTVNGVPLRVLEQAIDTNTFDDRYDARLEIDTGRIELKSASLKDLGGTFVEPNAGNSLANGTVTASLLDANAPEEVWSLRCFSVPMGSTGGDGYFSLSGSASGILLDDFGQPFLFQSHGVTTDNGVIALTITEGTTIFEKGDRFRIEVESGVLSQGDQLAAKYIAELDVNDPELFDTPKDLFAKHGQPSLTNTLSLGAQMAFENGAPQILAMQAKPAMPIRNSAVLLAPDNPLTTTVNEGATGGTDFTDLCFALPVGARPDSDTNVHVFVMNADGTEEQIFPNKEPFYSVPSDGINDVDFTQQTGSYSSANFSYTILETSEIEQSGIDGEVGPPGTTFSDGLTVSVDGYHFYSEGAAFKASDIGKSFKITIPLGISSTRQILSIENSNTVVLSGGAFTFAEANARWQLIDSLSTDKSTKLLLTKDLALQGTVQSVPGEGLRITYIDQKDADFFDTNWFEAYDKLEDADCQIVVPLPTQAISNIQQAGRVHVELMSNVENRKERVLMIGAQQGVSDLALTGAELVAVEDVGVVEGIQGDDPEEVLAGNIEDLQDFSVSAAYGGTFRVAYFWPDQIVRSVGGSNQTIHGFYQAAAASGAVAGNPNIPDPLTRKVLSGYTILRDKILRPRRLGSLLGAGVAAIQPVTGGGRIAHGRTTTQSGFAVEEELSVIFIRDAIARSIRAGMQGFIGAIQDPTLISSVTARADSFLKGYEKQGLITGSKNLSVGRNPIEPRQIDVSFQVLASIPLNWVYINISVDV